MFSTLHLVLGDFAMCCLEQVSGKKMVGFIVTHPQCAVPVERGL